MTQAAPPTYQCMVASNFNQDSQGNTTSYYGLWTPGNGAMGNEYYGASSYYPQFWVLDGKNPMGGAPQYFASPDSSTIPAGLAPLMNGQNLLVAGFAGPTSYAPSGALYEFLMANGSGAILTTLEQLNASLACGVFGFAAYAIVSVSGQGPNSGVEFGVAPAPLNYAGTNNITAAQSFFAFSLFPDNSGRYLPAASPL
jgi:hypothetical protein